ncbi:MAG TPA: hypothetical protein VHX88_07620 [Solirubrobacteraceae bacterium]|jgi:hypothetical protein|nr:hypothetical protein [Solirubrobacteraceae bacterium]
MPRFRRQPLPEAGDEVLAEQCLACGKEIERGEQRVLLDGVPFHDHCSIYRSWGWSSRSERTPAGASRPGS